MGDGEEPQEGCPARPPLGLSLGQEEDARQKLLEELPFAVLALDAAGCIAIVNRQTEALFGYSRYDLFGRAVEMLIPERLRAAHVALREGFTEDPKVRQMGAEGRLMGLHRNGREIPLSIHLSSITVAGVGVLPIAVLRRLSHDKERESP